MSGEARAAAARLSDALARFSVSSGAVLKIQVPRCSPDAQYKENAAFREVPEEGSEPSANGKEELGISTLV